MKNYFINLSPTLLTTLLFIGTSLLFTSSYCVFYVLSNLVSNRIDEAKNIFFRLIKSKMLLVGIGVYLMGVASAIILSFFQYGTPFVGIANLSSALTYIASAICASIILGIPYGIIYGFKV